MTTGYRATVDMWEMSAAFPAEAPTTSPWPRHRRSRRYGRECRRPSTTAAAAARTSRNSRASAFRRNQRRRPDAAGRSCGATSSGSSSCTRSPATGFTWPSPDTCISKRYYAVSARETCGSTSLRVDADQWRSQGVLAVRPSPPWFSYTNSFSYTYWPNKCAIIYTIVPVFR